LEYVYKNFVYNNQNNKGILYKDNKVLFMGNTWSGILQFLSATDNAPEVREMFKAQLEQREIIKFRAESKKPKDPEPIQRQETKKEPLLKRSRNDRRLVR
jgi:hypothetical protein|tara:strand:- start:451 stop:750 length:300 start_codon:yes stop_codon:yes gene_type:complete